MDNTFDELPGEVGRERHTFGLAGAAAGDEITNHWQRAVGSTVAR